MNVARSAIVATLMALACWPAAQAAVSAPVGPTPTTLYVHVLDFQDFPVNTQPPEHDRFTTSPAYGLAAHTLSCLPNPPTGAAPFADWHTWYGFSTPTYVDYDNMEDGKPRYNNQRGLSWDVPIDAAVPAVLHWYLQVGGGPGEAAPVPLANVVVQAELRAPDSITVYDAAYGTGGVVAQGRSAPALLAGDATQGAEHSMAGGQHVYGFQVPLHPEAGLFPGATGYTLSIQAYIENPVCESGSGNVMASQATPFSDAAHQPRIELAAADVLRIDSLEPSRTNGTLQVEAVFNSAWGSYDVDEGNVTLTIDGPEGPVVANLSTFVQRTREWYHFTEPVRATWTTERGLVDGLHWINLTVQNDQHTANAAAHAAFRVGPDRAYPAPEGGGLPDMSEPALAMPGPGAVLLASALAVLAATLAHRR